MIAAAPLKTAAYKLCFDPRDRARVHRYWDEVLASNHWTDGPFTRRFEERWSRWNDLPSVAMSNWAGGAMAALEFFGVRGRKVLVPTNTFIGTPFSVVKAGGEPVFADVNREDLCLSYDALVAAAAQHDLAAVWLVHIGGHLAFDSDRIADFCRRRGIVLLEDCAHAHGASWNGRKPGSWGDAGVYSFYASKSIPTGEGGMLVSRHAGLIEYARRYRCWGQPERAVEGLNHRMNEFTAALGLVQAERMEEIFAWKQDYARRNLDPVWPNRVKLPPGMVSGYYKYIVFDPVEPSATRVFSDLCHGVMRHGGSFPNAEWVVRNHWCVPLYYEPSGEAS